MTALQLQPAVFTILRDLLEDRVGLHFNAEDLPLLRDKISVRAVDASFDSLLDYYYFLRYDPSSATELDALVDDLVVNETYIFRELDALEQVVRHLLVPQVAAQGIARVWSAACATGEECLTLAMLLDEARILDQVEVLATDISRRALERARCGQLGRRSLRGPVPPALQRYVDVSDGVAQISPRLRESIEWRRLNLVDPEALKPLGQFDVILCRNVLIYFSDETTRAVVASLVDRLVPGGRLIIGTSESLLRFGTALVCEERGGAFFYRKAP
jgi:chemotaxis protein methyltransferase CheR